MSQENVEIVRQAFEEFQAGMEQGDPGAGFDSDAVADDYEYIPTNPFEGRSVIRGREEFVEFWRTWTQVTLTRSYDLAGTRCLRRGGARRRA
jgi:hypothetical protein